VSVLDGALSASGRMKVPDAFTVPSSYSRPRLALPPIGIGTMAWGDPRRGWGVNFDSEDLRAAFDILTEADITLFDTSEVYGYQGGRLFETSEQLLSSLIATCPVQPLVSTKFMPVLWANLLAGGGLRFGRQAVLEAVRNSIARLGVGSVDLYSLHAPLPYVGGRRALYEGLAMAYDLGLCRGVGLCNYNSAQTREAVRACRALGVPIVSNQFRYSLFNIERELDGTLETCLELGVVPVAHTPLAGGLASAKYAHALGRRGGRRGKVGRYDARQLLMLSHMFETMSAIANEGERRTESQVALRYVMAKGCVPVVGVNNAEQATQVASALEWELSLADIQRLSEQALSLHGRRRELPWLKGL